VHEPHQPQRGRTVRRSDLAPSCSGSPRKKVGTARDKLTAPIPERFLHEFVSNNPARFVFDRTRGRTRPAGHGEPGIAIGASRPQDNADIAAGAERNNRRLVQASQMSISPDIHHVTRYRYDRQRRHLGPASHRLRPPPHSRRGCQLFASGDRRRQHVNWSRIRTAMDRAFVFPGARRRNSRSRVDLTADIEVVNPFRLLIEPMRTRLFPSPIRPADLARRRVTPLSRRSGHRPDPHLAPGGAPPRSARASKHGRFLVDAQPAVWQRDIRT